MIVSTNYTDKSSPMHRQSFHGKTIDELKKIIDMNRSSNGKKSPSMHLQSFHGNPIDELKKIIKNIPEPMCISTITHLVAAMPQNITDNDKQCLEDIVKLLPKLQSNDNYTGYGNASFMKNKTWQQIKEAIQEEQKAAFRKYGFTGDADPTEIFKIYQIFFNNQDKYDDYHIQSIKDYIQDKQFNNKKTFDDTDIKSLSFFAENLNSKVRTLFLSKYLLQELSLDNLNKDRKEHVINNVLSKLYIRDDKRLFYASPAQIERYKDDKNHDLIIESMDKNGFNPFDLCFSKDEQLNKITNTMSNCINTMIKYIDIDIIHNIFIKNGEFFHTGRNEEGILNEQLCFELIVERVIEYYQNKGQNIQKFFTSVKNIKSLCATIDQCELSLVQKPLDQKLAEERQELAKNEQETKKTISDPNNKIPRKIAPLSTQNNNNNNNFFERPSLPICIYYDDNKDLINDVKKILSLGKETEITKMLNTQFNVNGSIYTIKKEQTEDNGCLGEHIRKFRNKFEYNLYNGNELIRTIDCTRTLFPGLRNNNKVGPEGKY